MRKTLLPLLCVPAVLLAASCMGRERELGSKRWTLDNGIRVVLVHVPASKNVSIFTFLPMGLAADGPGQSQWAHLIEHLVIRSTIPPGSQQANAETLADHMRLDFYGSLDNWQEGLAHHARWLKGIPFALENLQREKRVVHAECDFTARRLATHKFAISAWAQGSRHGRSHAALKGDIASATLTRIQQHRDKHLTVLDKTVVCVVGGLSAESARPVLAKQLGRITSRARAPQPVKLVPGLHKMTWDLDARHLVMSWPIPSPADSGFPPLMVAGQLLLIRCFADAELKAFTGTVLVGTDLTVPEGTFLYVSASLQPDASFDVVRQKIDAHVEALRSGKTGGVQVPIIARQQAHLLTTIPDPSTIRSQAPENTSAAMIEGNLGLRWGMQEFRYGPHRSALAKVLRTLNAKHVEQAARKYLAAEKCCSCFLSPR